MQLGALYLSFSLHVKPWHAFPITNYYAFVVGKATDHDLFILLSEWEACPFSSTDIIVWFIIYLKILKIWWVNDKSENLIWKCKNVFYWKECFRVHYNNFPLNLYYFFNAVLRLSTLVCEILQHRYYYVFMWFPYHFANILCMFKFFYCVHLTGFKLLNQ